MHRTPGGAKGSSLGGAGAAGVARGATVRILTGGGESPPPGLEGGEVLDDLDPWAARGRAVAAHDEGNPPGQAGPQPRNLHRRPRGRGRGRDAERHDAGVSLARHGGQLRKGTSEPR